MSKCSITRVPIAGPHTGGGARCHGAFRRRPRHYCVAGPAGRSVQLAITYTAPEYAEACEIAKIAVAVWRVNRAKFAEFHSWLFDPSYQPTAADALQRRRQLVGDAAIRNELNKPTARDYVARHVELYERVGSGSLPKILFGGTSVSGSVESASTLIDMINQNGLAPQ